MARMTLVLNQAAIDRLTQQGGLVNRGVQRAAGSVRDEARRIITEEGRIDTGALRQSIESSAAHIHGSHTATYRIGSRLDYAKYQHDGVRPFGPRRAKVLRWRSGGVYVFSTHSSGFAGIFFMTRALRRLSKSDFRKP